MCVCIVNCHNKEADFKRNGPDLNVAEAKNIYAVYIILKHACVVCLRNKIFVPLRQGRGRSALCCAVPVGFGLCSVTLQAKHCLIIKALLTCYCI